jgi:hypothetical protein
MAISDQEKSAIVGWLKRSLEEKPKRQQKENERVARRAIMRVLMEGEPLPGWLRWLLAERFEPDLADEEWFVLKPTRSRGRPRKVFDWEIATVVERHIRSGGRIQMKDACGHAAKALGVSKRTAEKAYAKEKEQVKALLDAAGVKIITRSD